MSWTRARLSPRWRRGEFTAVVAPHARAARSSRRLWRAGPPASGMHRDHPSIRRRTDPLSHRLGSCIQRIEKDHVRDGIAVMSQDREGGFVAGAVRYQRVGSFGQRGLTGLLCDLCDQLVEEGRFVESPGGPIASEPAQLGDHKPGEGAGLDVKPAQVIPDPCAAPTPTRGSVPLRQSPDAAVPSMKKEDPRGRSACGGLHERGGDAGGDRMGPCGRAKKSPANLVGLRTC